MTDFIPFQCYGHRRDKEKILAPTKLMGEFKDCCVSYITNRVASEDVFARKDWVLSDIELDPTITIDQLTVWILQDSHAYYLIHSIGGFMSKTKGKQKDEAYLLKDKDDAENTNSTSNEDVDLDAEDNIVSTRPYHYEYHIECKLNPSAYGDNDTGRADRMVFLVMVAPFIVHNFEVVKFYKLKDFFMWALKKKRGKSDPIILNVKLGLVIFKLKDVSGKDFVFR
ncbi:hypothetical protein MP638_005091 [Amoeboaphelidium occidentale]|nr:hypothetical protein MP638_005091 [Amoeboaphelidium occidentale]